VIPTGFDGGMNIQRAGTNHFLILGSARIEDLFNPDGALIGAS
jgi:hypothetical protein